MPKTTRNRIAYVTLQSIRGGQAAHVHVNEIIRGLEKLGWQISLFAAQTKLDSGMLRRIISFLWVQVRVMISIRSFRVIYVRWHAATAPVVLWAKAWRVPVCVEINGTYSDLFLVWPSARRLRRLLTWMMRVQLRCADARITVADALATWVTDESGGKSCAVIPNGADPEHFRPDVKEFPGIKHPYVAFVGAFSPWQGVETMLAAVHSEHWPAGVRLFLAGDGSEREQVVEAASQSNQIVYLGTVPYRSVPGLLAYSLAALSVQGGALAKARKDFSAIKVYEALACGVPVIVTPFPSQKKLVEEAQCGAVIPFDDSEALAKSVALFHDNPRIREEMGQRARQIAEDEHSWNCRAQATSAVLEHLIKQDR